MVFRLADMEISPVPFLWLCGASGVGKSFTGFEIFSRLWRAGVMIARVDFDDIGSCHPARDRDPGSHQLKAANLGVVWQNFQKVGARCLVGSGCVENLDVVAMYRDAVPGALLTLCRLRVEAEEQRGRIARRGHLLGAVLVVGANSSPTCSLRDDCWLPFRARRPMSITHRG